jgi:mycothiol synthase
VGDLRVVDEVDDGLRARVEALVAAAARADAHPPLGDAKLAALRRGGATFGVAAHETPAGLAGWVQAVALEDRTTWNLQTVVAPGGERDLRTALTAEAIAEAARRGARRVQWWVARAGPADDRDATALGLGRWRDLLQMHRPLPIEEEPVFPGTVRVRPFVPGRDDAAWLDVNGRAFAEHPEQRVFGAGDLKGRMEEQWFDPEGFLLAEEDDALVGFCWTKIPDAAHGEIYVIGVDPAHRGRGLGRALVLAGLHHMATRRLPMASLYVDGDNTAAAGLYRQLGFEVDHVDRAYAGAPT